MTSISWENGTKVMYFDVVEDQSAASTMQVTEHPVEKGANVADHVRKELDRISLNVFVTNAPNDDPNLRGAHVVGVDLDLKKATERGSAFQFPNSFDAGSDVLATLRRLQDTATLITVSTSSHDYEDMLLIDCSEQRNAGTGDGCSYKLEFKQIRIVETKLVSAPVPTEVRGKNATNKGAQGPKEAKDPPKKQSVLKSILDAGSKYFGGGS